MNNLAILQNARDESAAVDFMGPGRVLSVAGGRVVVRRGDGLEVEVQMALALPYAPREHDVLLLISGSGASYAVGVIHGTGTTSLTVPGDVDVHAVGGTLNLRGDRGVRMHGPAVEVVAERFKVIAERSVQKVTTLYQHVRELWSMKADNAHIAVSNDIHQRSKNATVLTEEVVTMNGKQIHLG